MSDPKFIAYLALCICFFLPAVYHFIIAVAHHKDIKTALTEEQGQAAKASFKHHMAFVWLFGGLTCVGVFFLWAS